MEHYIDWPGEKISAPVKIEEMNGVEQLLNTETISIRLKSSPIRNIGVVIDADDVFQSRWDSLRNLFKAGFPDIPTVLPPTGLICQNTEGKRLGIWIMPNNSSSGMLETFLGAFVSEQGTDNPLWLHANNSCVIAKEHGANYRSVHFDKAKIHSWLAWQDPPGDSFGTALIKKVLNPSAPSAQIFAQWFMELYQLPAKKVLLLDLS